MKRFVLAACLASLVSAGEGVSKQKEAPITEIEQSLKELEMVMDSLAKAYDEMDSAGITDDGKLVRAVQQDSQ